MVTNMNYYEVLGLPEGAGQKEIKRAYFKLVRQYSPEKDPERFQQIREAYERLTEDKDTEKEGIIALEFPDIPLASQMKEQIQRRMNARDYQGAMLTAEEALRYFGDFEGFLYFLAISQRHMGKTGKCVKNFEKLVRLFPDKLVYRKELAFSYMDRGFMNKAFQAFQTAYSKGVRDLNFLHMFALCCKDRCMYDQSVSLLLEVIGLAEKKPKENLELLIDSYSGIFFMGGFLSGSELKAARKKFMEFLRSAEPYIPEYEEEFLYMIQHIAADACSDPDGRELFKNMVEEIRRICSVNRKKKPDPLKEAWEDLDAFLEQTAIEEDTRLPDWLKDDYFALTEKSYDPQLAHFIKRDSQLCILEQWPGIKDVLRIVQDSYPDLYEEFEDFIHTLENTKDIQRLREQLLKDYERRAQYISGGYYYELYPDRRPKKPASYWDSDADGTFVRSQPKIGRNDPCPCGSGKKYKNCCGKNK